MKIIILCDQIDCAFNKKTPNAIIEPFPHQCVHPLPEIGLNLKFLKEQKCLTKKTKV